MWVNPFVSVDQQLFDIGWNRYYENENGFRYAKKIGVDVWHLADYNKTGIRFYDDMIIGHDYDSITVDEKELLLFAKKIKEWKGQYESKNNN